MTIIQTFKEVAELCLSVLKDKINLCQHIRSPSKLGKQTGLSARETSRCVNSHPMGGAGSRRKCLKVLPMYESRLAVGGYCHWLVGGHWVSPA